MKLVKEDLVNKIKVAMEAVTSTPIVPQSDHLVFVDGGLLTFDGEMLVRQEFDLGFEGAVFANDFLNVLLRFPDEHIEIESSGSEVVFKGRRKKAGVPLYEDISLPMDLLPKAGKYSRTDKELVNSLAMATEVCEEGVPDPLFYHVAVFPDRIEATNNYKMFRATVKTGFASPVFIHKVNLKKVCSIGFRSISTSGNWCFFKGRGLEMAVLSSGLDYFSKEQVDDILKVDGEVVTFPEEVIQVLERVEVMAAGEDFEKWVELSVIGGRVKVEARNDKGWFCEKIKETISGRSFSLRVNPKTFAELISLSRKVVVGPDSLGISFGKVQFVTRLVVGKD